MKLGTLPMTLRQLQYAVAVADELSFRRAAERCHVSQPSLSVQLAELEGALGVQLFERDRRRVMPTASGREIVERARQVLVAVEDIVELAQRSADPRSGRLRIGVIPTISPYLLPRVSAALKRQLPKLEIFWTEDKTASVMQKLEMGELDAVVVALESDIGDAEFAVLEKDAFVLAAPKEHPLARPRGRVGARELAGHGVLLLDDGHCFRDQALEVCASQRAKELEFRATSLSTLVQMVASGAGLTLLPELALGSEARRKDLVIRRFRAPVPHRTLVLAWRKRSARKGLFTELGSILSARLRGA
ncbi:MAG: LysR substrate-binding domain-containing protein [Polyangiaceae bacterium]